MRKVLVLIHDPFGSCGWWGFFQAIVSKRQICRSLINDHVDVVLSPSDSCSEWDRSLCTEIRIVVILMIITGFTERWPLDNFRWNQWWRRHHMGVMTTQITGTSTARSTAFYFWSYNLFSGPESKYRNKFHTKTQVHKILLLSPKYTVKEQRCVQMNPVRWRQNDFWFALV